MSGISNDLLPCIAAVCVCFNLCYGGTAVDFSSKPAVIVESLTKSVHMHCGVNDLSKRAWSTNATDDIDHVTQITVANSGGTIIAKVGEKEEVTVDHDKGGLTASGSVTGHAHLDLTFAAPSEMDMGVYKCNVIAISANNRHMFLGRTLNVKTRPATVPDVISAYKGDLHEVDSKLTAAFKGDLQEVNNRITACVSARVAFTAHHAPVIGAASYAKDSQVKYTDVVENINEDYDPSTGTFTCSEAGVYQFNLHLTGKPGLWTCLGLEQNGERLTDTFTFTDHNTKTNFRYEFNSASTSAVVKLAKGDTIVVKSVCGTSKINQENSDSKVRGNTFSGFLVSSDKCLP